MINHAGVTKSYESITKAAEDHNLSMKIVSKRLRSGWTNEQALGLDDAPIHESQNIKGIDVVIEGVTVSYRTLTEAAVTDRPESP